MNTFPKVRIGDLCELVNGKAFKPEDWSASGVPIIRIQNLNDANKPFNYWDGPRDRQVPIKRGDVLFAWSGTPGTSFGAHIWAGPDGILNQHIFLVKLDQVKITKEWWIYAVNNQLHELIGVAHGGVGLKHVTRRMIDNLEIPLPPLSEQRRIVTILDQADELRRKRQRAIDRLNQLGQAIFYEMFGDAKSPSGWQHQQRDIAEVCIKVTDGTHQSPKWADDGVPFIFVSNVRNQRIDLATKKFVNEAEYQKLTKHTKIEVGDVLYTCVGSYGHAAVVDGRSKFVFQRHIAHLKPSTKLIQPQFLAWCLESSIVRAQADRVATGIAQKTVTLSGLKSFKVPLPPLDRQEDFATRLAELNETILASETHLTKLEALFNASQHRAFRGEL